MESISKKAVKLYCQFLHGWVMQAVEESTGGAAQLHVPLMNFGYDQSYLLAGKYGNPQEEDVKNLAFEIRVLVDRHLANVLFGGTTKGPDEFAAEYGIAIP